MASLLSALLTSAESPSHHSFPIHCWPFERSLWVRDANKVFWGYQLCSKKKRKINPLWRLLRMLGLQVTEKKANRENTVVEGRETQTNKDEVACLVILINFRKQLQLWIDNWAVFCVCFWLIVVLWMSLCRKWRGSKHACIGKCVSALTQLGKCFHSLCLKAIVIIFVLLSPVAVCPDAGIFTG